MIRVVIVDDQAVIRAGVARILSPADGFEIIAECTDGDEVGAAIATHRPDVVLMDIRMRRTDGITALRGLRQSPNSPPVLILTTFDDDDVLWGALEAGEAGFVLKDTPAEDMITATRAVAVEAPGSTRKSRPASSARSAPAPGHDCTAMRAPRNSPSASTTCCVTSPAVRTTPKSPVRSS